jgi:hypothetical protein
VSYARAVDVIDPLLAEARVGNEVLSRSVLWETIAQGLDALAKEGAHAPTGEACAARVARWVRAKALLSDGGRVDRALVEALLEASSTSLVHAGRDVQQVAAACERFVDRSLGLLLPAPLSSN